QIVRFDAKWAKLESWSFPPELIQRFGANSSSGGGFGQEGLLFVTGHDAKELYVLEFPKSGPVMKWIATIPISAAGQAFNWDPVKPEMFYSINRKTREVIVSRIGKTA